MSNANFHTNITTVKEVFYIESMRNLTGNLLTGTARSNLSTLQHAQNSIARVATGTSRFDHMRPVLKNYTGYPWSIGLTSKYPLKFSRCVNRANQDT